MTTGAARIGCSGWSYRAWRGPFYAEDAPARTWFAQYAAHFDTVELNATFYRLPTVEAVEGWAGAAPAGFVYAAKVGQFGTHRRKLREPGSWLPNHLDRVRRLGRHLGPNLFQLPPRWRVDVGRLRELLALLPKDLRWAVELRDPSWLLDEVYDALAEHEVALCLHDLLPSQPWLLTADWTYLRFHGPDAVHEPYRGRYGPRRLGTVAERLGGWLADGIDVYGYFNNDTAAEAPRDAAWLRARLAPGQPSSRKPAMSSGTSTA